MPARISIVVPVHNGGSTIRSCIEALVAQRDLADWVEIIIVDNNSTDNTVEIVRDYPVTLLHRTDTQSSYAARNLGIQHAIGELVLFTDADCIPAPDWASVMVACFAREEVVGVGGHIEDAQPTNDIERLIAEVQPLRNAVRLEGIYYRSVVTANAAFRRRVLTAVRGFDERMFTGGDIDLSWRIQKQGLGEVVFAPAAVVFHKHRSSLRGMYRQFHRYGYCSGMMTALHRTEPEYPQTANWQARTALAQVRALLTYVGSLAYRNTVGWFQRRSAYERKKPALLFVAELGALAGRFRAFLDTRLFTQPPQRLPKRPG